MKERSLGIATSIAVHSCLIPLIVFSSLTMENKPAKVVDVDFALIKDRLREYSQRKNGEATIERRSRNHGGAAVPKKTAKPVGPHREDKRILPAEKHMEPSPIPTIITTHDPQGETVIHATAATHASPSGEVDSLHSHGDGDGVSTGGFGTGRGTGQGGGGGNQGGTGGGLMEGSRDYNYIRDAIMRNIRYPDEAIRSGVEGKVFLSFIVLESGTMSKIKVERGSGCRFLDESAKEAVAITRISRKVPYRVVVHLPITYKLQE